MDKTHALIVEFRSASRVAAHYLGINGSGADFEALSFLRERYLRAFKECGINRPHPDDVAAIVKEKIGSRFRSYRRNLANFAASFREKTFDKSAMDIAAILGADVHFADLTDSNFQRARELYIVSESLIDYGVAPDGAIPSPSAVYLAHVFGLERLSFIQEKMSGSPKADAEKTLYNQIENIRLFAIPATNIGTEILKKTRDVEQEIAACLNGPPRLTAPLKKDVLGSDRFPGAPFPLRKHSTPFLTLIDGGKGPS